MRLEIAADSKTVACRNTEPKESSFFRCVHFGYLQGPNGVTSLCSLTQPTVLNAKPWPSVKGNTALIRGYPGTPGSLADLQGLRAGCHVHDCTVRSDHEVRC
mmetsp:Transcript_87071/g.281919  ORF Transcript_87071/g.281919 Transcript_87071/m.281919 type:complete len:102 (-) Transcript_87071:448-753(-)